MLTDLTCTYHRGTARVALRGAPDHRDLDLLRHHLDEALDRHVSLVAVDLEDVTAVDASTLGALVSAHHRTIRAGVALALVAPSRPVRRRLELTNLDDVFPIVDEVPAAWAVPSA